MYLPTRELFVESTFFSPPPLRRLCGAGLFQEKSSSFSMEPSCRVGRGADRPTDRPTDRLDQHNHHERYFPLVSSFQPIT